MTQMFLLLHWTGSKLNQMKEADKKVLLHNLLGDTNSQTTEYKPIWALSFS